MSRVRIVIYRELSDDKIGEFICEHPDVSSERLAGLVKGLVPDDMLVEDDGDAMGQMMGRNE
jgi:hypothetical protein